MLEAVAPYYFWIKAIHVISVAIWSFSTAVAYAFYVKPAIKAWERRPSDPSRTAVLDESMLRFDRGAAFEHVALVVMIVTAVMMIWIRDINLMRWSFIPFMFWVGVAVIVPMETADIWLTHLGGNKERLKRAGDTARYAEVMNRHILFLKITEPIVIVLIPTFFIIAIVKPF